MAKALSAFVRLIVVFGALASKSQSKSLAEPYAENFVNVTLGGVTYTNKVCLIYYGAAGKTNDLHRAWLDSD